MSTRHVRFAFSSCAACAAPAAVRRRPSCWAPRWRIPRASQVTVCYLRDQRDDVFGDRSSGPRALAVDYVEVARTALVRSAALAAAAPARSRSAQIDLVHAHDYKTNLLALLLSKAAGRRAAVDRARLDRPLAARALSATTRPTSGVLARFPRVDRRVERDRRAS